MSDDLTTHSSATAEENGCARPKKSGQHRWKMLPWRPPGPLLERIEEWRAGASARTDLTRYTMSQALEHLIELGLEAEECKQGLSRTDAFGIESRLDVTTAQLDDLGEKVDSLMLLLDALGPACLAAPRALTAWMAADPDQQDIGESVEMAQDRLLDAVETASEDVWTFFRDQVGEPSEAGVGEAAPVRLIEDVLGKHNGSDAPEAGERIGWAAPVELRKRLERFVSQKKMPRAAAISAFVELGLEVVEGQATVPRHRAAELAGHMERAQADVRRLGERIDILRRRVDLLGSKVCGMPEVLVRWQAHDPELAGDVAEGDEEAIRALEMELLERYWAEAQLSWQAVVDSLNDVPAEEDDEDEMLFGDIDPPGGKADEFDEEFAD